MRKSEDKRLTGHDRRFTKGQKYALLSRRENFTVEGRAGLQLPLRANKRLHTAYVLKESFSELWDYQRRLGAPILQPLVGGAQVAAPPPV